MRFSTDWIDQAPNVSAEERATLCRLRLFVSGQNACRFLDADSTEGCDHLTIPAVHLAEGLATDWWSIFGGRDRDHPIRKYRTGFALPDVTLAFDGSTLEVRGRQYASVNPDLHFWQVDAEAVPRDAAESTLAAFIESVVGRLASAGVSDSAVALCWARVAQTLKDPEELAFCEAAGALGVDPYEVEEHDALFIERAAELFSGEALIEFLAGVRTEPRGDLLRWVQAAEDTPRDQSRLPALDDAAGLFRRDLSRAPAEPGWAAGYRAARAFRADTGIAPGERLTSLSEVAGRLGASRFACTPGVPGIHALVRREGDGVRIHVRDRGSAAWASAAESFAFARAIGDVVCFGDAERSVVNGLHRAERQAAGRAFAAEFLAPVEGVLDMAAGGADDEEIAGSFHVSPTVVARQLENHERIRAACTERADRAD